MARTVLYLLRHAETQWNRDKRIQGQWDSELHPDGHAAAVAFAPLLEGLGFSRILSSDLGRAKFTAGIFNLRLRLPVTLERRLREQHFGQWTGKYWRDIPEEDKLAATAAGWDFRPPGGEARSEVRQRAEHALIDAARINPGRTLLVVTHQGVLKAVLYDLLGRDYTLDAPAAFDLSRLQRLVCQDGVLAVDALDVDPAKEVAAPDAP
jgi:probable phosphoglycerate mutase